MTVIPLVPVFCIFCASRTVKPGLPDLESLSVRPAVVDDRKGLQRVRGWKRLGCVPEGVPVGATRGVYGTQGMGRALPLWM